MSWLFSQALVEAFSEDICSDGEPSVQSSGNPTQQAYCAPDKMTKFFRLSRFGMTYKPLTEDRGEELCKSYREAFLARTSVPQARELVSQASGQVCGDTWHGLLARYDPNSHSWKTAQCSLFEDLELSLETFPKWGMTVGMELYPLPVLVQTTSETESGLWPTPNTLEGLKPKKIERIMEYNQKARPGRSYASMNLREQVVYGKQPIWPTPNAWDGKRGPMSKELMESGAHQITLVTAVKHFQTPVARMFKDNGQSPAELNRNSETLAMQAGGSLNPTWVEWLMGWPLGWTDLKPLEMDKSHSALQQHGHY